MEIIDDCFRLWMSLSLGVFREATRDGSFTHLVDLIKRLLKLVHLFLADSFLIDEILRSVTWILLEPEGQQFGIYNIFRLFLLEACVVRLNQMIKFDAEINQKPDPAPRIKARGPMMTKQILMIANTANLSMNFKKGLPAVYVHRETYIIIVMISEALKQIAAISKRQARTIRHKTLRKLVILQNYLLAMSFMCLVKYASQLIRMIRDRIALPMHSILESVRIFLCREAIDNRIPQKIMNKRYYMVSLISRLRDIVLILLVLQAPQAMTHIKRTKNTIFFRNPSQAKSFWQSYKLVEYLKTLLVNKKHVEPLPKENM